MGPKEAPAIPYGCQVLTSNYFLPQTFLISISHLSHSTGHSSQSPVGLDPTQVVWPPFFTSLARPRLGQYSLGVQGKPYSRGEVNSSLQGEQHRQAGLSENRKHAGMMTPQEPLAFSDGQSSRIWTFI